MSSFLGFLETIILVPLYYVVSAVLLAWHWLFEQIPGFNEADGWVWVVSIIGLTFTIRAALIPLFVKQIKSSRNMQLLQPKIRELQKKYGHDRERMAQEQMKLWKETGTNPFASCLPILLQMPIFFALFRVLNLASRGDEAGLMTERHVDSIQEATIFGANIAETFLNGEGAAIRIVAIILVIAMCATTFLTQYQLMRKNMPPEALVGQQAQMQKIMLYVLPFAFAFGGFFFPLGVLVYWTTSNLWTMGQQFYVIRNNPVPGTPAFEAKQERDRASGKIVVEDPSKVEESKAPPKPRQQPKSQSRSQRKKGSGGPNKKGKK